MFRLSEEKGKGPKATQSPKSAFVLFFLPPTTETMAAVLILGHTRTPGGRGRGIRLFFPGAGGIWAWPCLSQIARFARACALRDHRHDIGTRTSTTEHATEATPMAVAAEG